MYWGSQWHIDEAFLLTIDEGVMFCRRNSDLSQRWPALYVFKVLCYCRRQQLKPLRVIKDKCCKIVSTSNRVFLAHSQR